VLQGDGSAAELVNRCLTISLITTFFMLVAFTVFNLSAGAFVSPINHWSAVPNILPICLQVQPSAAVRASRTDRRLVAPDESVRGFDDSTQGQ